MNTSSAEERGRPLLGVALLVVGVVLLLFTFYNAYQYLVQAGGLLPRADLTEVFGEAFAPLVEAIIRVMFLGVMGWIGSIVTSNGVKLFRSREEGRAQEE